MEDKGKSEELIDKLIRKRKEENDAFMKLLNAIENKGNESHENAKPKSKGK
jgi:hypothetical protein